MDAGGRATQEQLPTTPKTKNADHLIGVFGLSFSN
jgi:hypothetical protein